MLKLMAKRLLAGCFLALLGACSLASSRGGSADSWQIQCSEAPKFAVNTLQDLGYRITGRFDPSAKSQGLVTAKRKRLESKDRVSVVLQCKSGLFGRGPESVEVVPRPIAWEPNKSDFPARFRSRFAEYVAGTAEPLPHQEPVPPDELVAGFLPPSESEHEFGGDLGVAGILAISVEVRNLSKRAFLVSSDLVRLVTADGAAMAPLSLQEVSGRIAQSSVGNGRQIYSRVEKAYLGHGSVAPGKARSGLLFFAPVSEGELVFPVVDSSSGEVRKLTASIAPLNAPLAP